jgi:CRISPR-associated protein Cmr1
MRNAEERIWGSSGEKEKPGPSPVTVFISEHESGTIDHPFEVIANERGRPQIRHRHGSQVHPYAAFPLQPQQSEAYIGMETKGVYVGVTFTLELTYPRQYKEDIEDALWAWETFGGIGARTRRGFGALQCTEVNGNNIAPPTQEEFCDRFPQELQKRIVKNGSWPAGVPYLCTDIQKNKLINREGAPHEVWYDLIDSLKNFRQFRPGMGTTHPGRSYWPEPEEIRARTGQRLPRHTPLPNAIRKFPRAKYGLPIIFHFKNMDRREGYEDNPDADPRETTLRGLNHDRLASPLILRPIACSDGSLGLAAILEWDPVLPGDESYTPPGGLYLKDALNIPPIKSDISPHEVGAIHRLHGNVDVLQAFLDSLR